MFQGNGSIVKFCGRRWSAARRAWVGAIERVINASASVPRRCQTHFAIFRRRNFRRCDELFIDPSKASLNILFKPLDFFLKRIADEMIGPDSPAKNRPPPKIASLGLIQLSRHFIDPR